MQARLTTRSDEKAFNTINLFETLITPLNTSKRRQRFVF